jgi:hypothetical protein
MAGLRSTKKKRTDTLQREQRVHEESRESKESKKEKRTETLQIYLKLGKQSQSNLP